MQAALPERELRRMAVRRMRQVRLEVARYDSRRAIQHDDSMRQRQSLVHVVGDDDHARPVMPVRSTYVRQAARGRRLFLKMYHVRNMS